MSGWLGYVRDHGRLPPLDWATIVAFIGIAGAGGLSNTLFSNYARDKGWGMGSHVGAIPSAIGGRTIGLSHIGCAFLPQGDNLARWRGWMRHIVRDQGIWIVASILGMALPCMMSLEFIRNATVTGDRVAAMTAEGIADRYPAFGWIFWITTLSCGFLVLAPGQVSVCDQIARRWTDMIWTASARPIAWAGAKSATFTTASWRSTRVWGLVILWFLPGASDRQDRGRPGQPGAGLLDLAGTLRQPRVDAQRVTPACLAPGRHGLLRRILSGDQHRCTLEHVGRDGREIDRFHELLDALSRARNGRFLILCIWANAFGTG